MDMREVDPRDESLVTGRVGFVHRNPEVLTPYSHIVRRGLTLCGVCAFYLVPSGGAPPCPVCARLAGDSPFIAGSDCT